MLNVVGHGVAEVLSLAYYLLKVGYRLDKQPSAHGNLLLSMLAISSLAGAGANRRRLPVVCPHVSSNMQLVFLHKFHASCVATARHQARLLAAPAVAFPADDGCAALTN